LRLNPISVANRCLKGKAVSKSIEALDAVFCNGTLPSILVLRHI
jgi:hypothetical protein